MDEMAINNRMTEIMTEFSQLKQLDDYDLSLESLDSTGNIKVLLKMGKELFAERIITPHESLDFIQDTFKYPETFHPRSRDMSLNGLKTAYFDVFGRLVTEREDAVEVFKVKDTQREEVWDILKTKLGGVLGKPNRVAKEIEEAAVKEPKELMYKVFYTENGIQSYFIISGDTIPGVRKTALDVIMDRGLDVEVNNIFSEQIKG